MTKGETVHIESPLLLATNGVIQPDFVPQLLEQMVKIELRGKRIGEKTSVAFEERKIVVRHYGLVLYDHEYRDHGRRLSARPRWYVGREEMAMFWHVFDASWDRDGALSQIKPGLNVYFCWSDWGDLTLTRSSKTGTRTSMMYGPVAMDDVESLGRLELLQTEKQSERRRTLERQIGEELYDFVVRQNWVDWMAIKFSLGREPSFKIPEPRWTVANVRMLLPYVQQEVLAGWNRGLADRKPEAQKILNYMDALLEKDFNPSYAITKLTRMSWRLWPISSFLHGALYHGIQDKIARLLKQAVSA